MKFSHAKHLLLAIKNAGSVKSPPRLALATTGASTSELPALEAQCTVVVGQSER
jgi:hypothetical protein